MQKDFSQKSMVSRENAFKKRPLKVHYLGNEQEFQKVGEVGPPLKLKINWGLLSTFFSNFDLLWSEMDFFDFFGLFLKAFSLETIDFYEKSFCTAVSRYNISHMTKDLYGNS